MTSVSTEYWHRLPIEVSDVNKGKNLKIQCDLCPRYCKLSEGQRGLCFIRSCENHEILMNSYGRSSGFCIDPIEKKPLNHFLPGTSVLSFGTAGCNLACKFCQNWDMSKSREMDKLSSHASPEQLANAAHLNGCHSIAFTYNDPVIFFEYALDVADACKEKDIYSVAVTAGYICEKPREKFFAKMDATNIDLKAFTEAFYWKQCGAHLQNILETIEYVHKETDCWLELTTLLIPDENDSDKELHELCLWVRETIGSDVPIHFSAFHPDWKMRDKTNTPIETLRRARKIALGYGLNFVYTGNVHDKQGDTTNCSNCGTSLIERDWYQLLQWNLDAKGQCLKCARPLPGVFEATPGTRGTRSGVLDPALF